MNWNLLDTEDVTFGFCLSLLLKGGIDRMAMALKNKGTAGTAGTKAPEQIQFQIEVETEQQWRNLCRREGLISENKIMIVKHK